MDTSAIIALAVGVPTFLAAVGTLILQWRANREGPKRQSRAPLAAKLAEAEQLLAEVLEGDPNRDFSGLDRRIVKWRDETVSLLERTAPDQIPLFHSNAGMTFFSSQYVERDRLANYLRGRSARLGDILGRT